jgi:uncharacterized damage-inducible protein DinB
MKSCALVALSIMAAATALAAEGSSAPSKSAVEFAKRWDKTRKMMVGVAEAMPPGEYAFKPDPPSMSFGEQMSHIAQANYASCYGLKDLKAPSTPVASDKESLVKFVGESFDYCTSVLNTLTDEQLAQTHSSPDGRLLGREILLALYAHMAHHRGQAEIYLRIKGIAPPPYIF